jgi:DNA adenine methylase
VKSPIIYYGGKTNMLKHILPLIPGDHRIFVEPFFGGGAVFFGKEKSDVEVINDNLDMAVNFYQVLKNNYPELKQRIDTTLHAEQMYLGSRNILKNPEQFDEVSRAWAFWAQAALCFSHTIFGGFAFAKSKVARTTANRVDQFTEELSKRLRHTQIFCRNALDVIERFDSKDTFFYLDPPYANSDCGHYNKGRDVFYDLLKLLPKLKGKWLLSSYPGEELNELRKITGANFRDVVKNLSVSGKHNAGKTKTECLTWNYPEQNTP